MKRTDETALAEFYTEKGEFFGRTLAAEWTPPHSVAMADGALIIQSTRQFRTGPHSGRLIRAPHGLLDAFAALGDTSGQRNTLGSVAKCASGLLHTHVQKRMFA